MFLLFVFLKVCRKHTPDEGKRKNANGKIWNKCLPWVFFSSRDRCAASFDFPAFTHSPLGCRVWRCRLSGLLLFGFFLFWLPFITRSYFLSPTAFAIVTYTQRLEQCRNTSSQSEEINVWCWNEWKENDAHNIINNIYNVTRANINICEQVYP